eukprot:1133377-Rhodomonas_salina.5
MRLKGLEGVIGTSIVHPTWQKTDPETDDHSGWAFTDPDDPPVTNQKGRRPNTLQDARGFLKRGDSTRCKDPAHILPCGAPEMIQLLHGCVLSSACSKIAGHGSFGHEGVVPDTVNNAKFVRDLYSKPLTFERVFCQPQVEVDCAE